MVQAIRTDIQGGMNVGDAVDKQGIVHSVYRKWHKQLEVGIKSSLRNGKPPIDKDKKHLELEIEKLKTIILSQSEQIAALKKETNWD